MPGVVSGQSLRDLTFAYVAAINRVLEAKRNAEPSNVIAKLEAETANVLLAISRWSKDMRARRRGGAP